MTPREELLQRAGDALCEDDPLEALANLFDEYAIGKWVPVSERLPEFGRSNMWSGTFKTDSGRVVTAQCHKDVFGTRYVTHWLELDIPEVES
jgi:hypothetical protein